MNRRDLLKLIGVAIVAPVAAITTNKVKGPWANYHKTGGKPTEQILESMCAASKNTKFKPPLKNPVYHKITPVYYTSPYDTAKDFNYRAHKLWEMKLQKMKGPIYV